VYLKKLELVGFKSFPEKSQFLFNEGITCIVGPNGCGKTNLLDALRWVLGEQKTSLLRGNKMEEVIFAGTRTLKPLGMAEVTLHVDNRDGRLPSQFPELMISRRLFRSGDSEYLMNKIPCRLRDITDLFADTGVGAHAYAIIQQDMVDAILSDRTEERRFLFEEAAGITKYKHRKKAAERKLEATEHDLLRLKDILGEVTTHVISLRRQVKKAERYQSVSEELKAWELFHAQTKYRDWQDKRKDLHLATRALDERKVIFDSQLDGRFAELEASRTNLAEVDQRLSTLAGMVLELSEKAHQVETDISVNREKLDNFKTTISQNRDDIDALSKRAAVIREEKGKAEEQIEQLGRDIASRSVEFEQAVAAQQAADREYLQFRTVSEDENAKLVGLEGRISSGRTDSANVEEQMAELVNDIEHHHQRRGNLSEEKTRRRQKIAEIQQQSTDAAANATTVEQSLVDKQNELDRTVADAERLRDELADLSLGYEATLARKTLLTEMVEHYEGYGSGVVAVFEVAQQWPAITGTVADVLRPQREYQAAIEAALGETAQFIISDDQRSAQEAVGYLRDRKAGRATFLILEQLPESISRPNPPEIAGVIGWADAFVECDQRYQRAPVALLGQTVICQDVESAQNALRQLPGGFRVATLSGDVYSKDGHISGGASEETSLIGRKNEIEALENALAQTDGKIKSKKDEHAHATLAIGELRQTLARLSQSLADEKDRISELMSHVKEEQFKISAADEVITSVDQQIEQISQKVEKLKHRQYTLALDFEQLGREKATLVSSAETKKAHLDQLEQAAHQADEHVNQLQMGKIEMESKRTHVISQRDYFEEMLVDIAVNIEQKQHQISDAETAIAELSGRVREDESRLKQLFDSRQQEAAVQQDLRRHRDEITTGVSVLEEQIKTLRREKEQIADERHQAEISLTEINSRMEQLEERTRNDHRMDIRELNVASPNPDLTAEQVTAHIEELHQHLERMGIVNLLALEEYQQQKERQDFLTRQLDDLINAKATLQATIQKINQTARNMFLETMGQARENFKKMYMELFTGGEADVILVDESNPLESPIEIISRPRGKRPLTITQLSGGERALTAISLLFALYMVKPSPFCFLDEIDAPLDDVNVGRFLKIVRTFSQQTQFVIITHNKITMEAADTLYGVTMEEPGVSKVVAVRFKKGDEDRDLDTILDMHYADDNLTQAG
jgi:chromosome segregation protein